MILIILKGGLLVHWININFERIKCDSLRPRTVRYVNPI
jgi:hypothetical protein